MESGGRPIMMLRRLLGLGGLLLAASSVQVLLRLRRPATRRKAARRPGPAAFAKAVYGSWIEDRAPKMAAALAYYTAFAVAPLLLIAVAVAGLLFGREAAQGELVRQLASLIGQDGAELLQGLLQRAWRPRTGVLATLLGVAALLLASSGVFAELQDSLNTVWKVRKKPGRGILGTVKDRFLSFSMVLGTGFLLLVSLILSSALEAVAPRLPSGGLWRLLHDVLSLTVISLLFASIFKLLPDARTRWKDAWIGGGLTALLFTAGKLGIGLYLGRSTFGSAYGAAGSFVVFLLWVNYSAQILFLGAEFTKAWADRFGSPPRPDADAVEIRRPTAVERGGRGGGGGGSGAGPRPGARKRRPAAARLRRKGA